MPKPSTLTLVSKSDNAQILESACFKDGQYFIEKWLSKGKSVAALFDIDNTIISYRHTLGTDQWFAFDFNKFINQGLSTQQAKSNTLVNYLNIIKKIHPEDIYVVEEDTPEIIREIQALGIDVLALTSRGSYLLEETVEQLARFGIDFNQGSYKDVNQKLSQSEEGIFYNGMILSAGQHKGECLFSCLQKVPECIVMWDDSLLNLQRVQASIDAYNQSKLSEDKAFTPVKFVGIRYSKLDALIQNVKPEVVELQRKYNDRILSDEHAKYIIKAERKKTRQHCVDIEYRGQENKIYLSVNKFKIYKILKDIMPDIEKYQILGTVKEFFGKQRLAWRFEFTSKVFQPLFHKLSQHGLILQDQFDVLQAVFSEPKKTLMTTYHLRARRMLSCDKVEREAQPLDADATTDIKIDTQSKIRL
ncbi:DUF2608 domain-containing protein [Candidatus Berkiella cookevillensis]|uniref:DUF2608 domain-containing protein n=1 Tax=Candidatus Berkiella cookevillensis TaxID=437022 RepID=A0A0Q9YHH7_9GAMM|nr:DUF2608 domain-containing protein [Candidatus Berkiella cookevillensis]MCS5708392.1 DUF2608 domain-containing protein [Candidatus Berkiella cookevillensis]